MVDQIFSFGELGFQEVETSRYIGDSARQRVHDGGGIAGIPTAWMATWGSGKPVIALGSDIDGIPQVLAEAGGRLPVAVDPEEAPGHGEGHNSGQAVNIAAALAVKRDHGAREHQGHAQALARCRRGAARHQGVVRQARASSGTSTSRCSRTSPTACRRRGARRRATASCPSNGKFRGEPAHGAQRRGGGSARSTRCS